MERAIDRTSYRRSSRQKERGYERLQKRGEEEIEEETEVKHFTLKNILLNQMIVSLLIMLGILLANYFEIEEVTEWIKKELSGGYRATEIVNQWVAKWNKPSHNFMQSVLSGDKMLALASGEKDSGEVQSMVVSGENQNGGEWISAVEGINQMVEDVKVIKEKYTIVSPLEGTITSPFGVRVSDNPIVSSYHTGLDIATESGTAIQSIGNGIVKMAESYGTYGNCVIVEDGDLQVLYAHCSAILVKQGDKVQQGDTIAKVGMTGNATGPHLHIEIRYQDRLVNPELVL